MLLNGLAAETVYYWHDFGHAHTLATLDLVNLDSWLPSFHQSTLGLHIHDAIALRDHRAAGFGDIDQAFAWLDKAVDEEMVDWELIKEPMFEDLHRDPRFERLRRRLGL